MNWLSVSERVKSSLQLLFLNIGTGLKHPVLICLSLLNKGIYNTRSQMALNIPLQKISTGHQALSFLRPKIWTKINDST